MLDELHVHNIALIKDASVSPSKGLTVFSGETGAGKTALLSALKLIMGQRSDVSCLRDGAQEAVVEGRFFDDEHPDGLIVSRRLSLDGKSRAALDGSMCSAKQLSSDIGKRVDVCGQHEHQRLLKSSYHMGMLDLWAGDRIGDLLNSYKAAFAAYEEAACELQRTLDAQSSSDAALDEARYTLSRIDEISPIEGEYETLVEQLPRIENMESLLQGAHNAYELVASDGGALERIHAALVQVESMSALDASLKPSLDALYSCAYSLEDVVRDLRTYKDSMEFSPEVFEETQERMSALQGLMRSFGPTMADVFAARNHARELIDITDHYQDRVIAAQKQLAQSDNELRHAAEQLDARRRELAPVFSDAVTLYMGKLNMEGAQLLCAFEDLPRESWTKEGSSKMEFQYRAGAGMTPRPLVRIASGGEVSRVMLACKVVLGAADDRDTLVFDEVDAGVGGQTAVALADVLADLAHTHQVLVITHLASVAVRADRHYVVKKMAGDMPETCVCLVEGENRVNEISRMLSGDTTPETRAHARRMIEEYQGQN